MESGGWIHNPAVYISITIAAACGFALAAVFQRQEAVNTSEDAALKPSLLIELAKRPLWLVGIGLYIAAYALQVIAVGLGPVVIVQPLISTQLVFALLFGVWFSRQKAGWQDWLGALAVVAGIALFIVATDPSPGDAHASALEWIVAAAAVTLLTAASLAAGWKFSGQARSALWGVAAGFMWGLMIVLMKTVTAEFSGPGTVWAQLLHMFEAPYVYGVIVSTLAGFMFLQSAFQAGSLTNALVAYTVVEIVIAVILGIVLFGEKPHDDALSLSLVALSSVILLGGIVLLAPSPAVSGQADA
jgi:drug/metabolite transporter (DMT)-like permease